MEFTKPEKVTFWKIILTFATQNRMTSIVRHLFDTVAPHCREIWERERERERERARARIEIPFIEREREREREMRAALKDPPIRLLSLPTNPSHAPSLSLWLSLSLSITLSLLLLLLFSVIVSVVKKAIHWRYFEEWSSDAKLFHRREKNSPTLKSISRKLFVAEVYSKLDQV